MRTRAKFMTSTRTPDFIERKSGTRAFTHWPETRACTTCPCMLAVDKDSIAAAVRTTHRFSPGIAAARTRCCMRRPRSILRKRRSGFAMNQHLQEDTTPNMRSRIQTATRSNHVARAVCAFLLRTNRNAIQSHRLLESACAGKSLASP